MIPVLYDRIGDYIFNNTPTWTKIGTLRDALSCVETSSINSEWELVMEYPMNGLHAEDIQLMRFIRTTQPFFVYRINKNAAAHIMIVYARHINYLMSFIPTYPFSRTQCNFETFLNNLGVPRNNIFHFQTDEETAALTPDITMLSNNVPPSSLRDYLLNPDYGVIAYYGGEWTFNEVNCTLLPRKGQDRNITIKYGVDLVDARQDECLDNMVTHVSPYIYMNQQITATFTGLQDTNNVQRTFKYMSGGKMYTEYSRGTEYPKHDQVITATPNVRIFPGNSTDPEDTVITNGTVYTGQNRYYVLPGAENLPFKKYATVDLIEDVRGSIPKIIAIAGIVSTSANGTVPITTGLVANDGSSDTRISTDYTNYRQTVSHVGYSIFFTGLREVFQRYLDNHPFKFPVDITVRSLPEFMTGVHLGDMITVEYPDYGISTQAEITTMEYDALREQIISYTLGNGRTSFAETMLHQNGKIDKLDGLVTARVLTAGQ